MLLTIFPTTEFATSTPAGLMIQEVVAAGRTDNLLSETLLESATMPLNNADHAARPADGLGVPAPTFTESAPRAALSLKLVVNTSNNSRSATGTILTASKNWPYAGCVSPVHCAQVLGPMFWFPWPPRFMVAERMLLLLRNTVCHGVPRCTRAIQPTVGYWFVGKSQFSGLQISGSLSARLYGLESTFAKPAICFDLVAPQG